MMSGKKEINNGFFQLLLVFVITRFFLEAIGLLSVFYFPSARSIFHISDLKYHQDQPAFLEIWTRWDSEWYLLISEKGYASYEDFREAAKGKYLPQDTAKFFPLYPLAIRGLTFLLRNSVLSGFLLANVCASFFLYYFYRLASKLTGPESALHGSLLCILFPTSFFLSAVYSESLFLACLLACFYYLEERRLVPAALACSLCVLARPQGMMAIPAFLILAWSRFPDKRLISLSLILISSLLPLAAFGLFIQQSFGSVSWINQAQQYWRGEIKYPLYAFTRFFSSQIAIHGQHNSMIDFGMACINLLVLIVAWRSIPMPYYVYSIIVVLFPLSSSLFSFSRLCLVNFPLFMYLGDRLRGRWSFVVQAGFAMLLAFFMAAFAGWYWVG